MNDEMLNGEALNGGAHYFAFGSNLYAPQMEQRCPEAEVSHPAVLQGYRLAFCGRSEKWGGGVATILPRKDGQVPGRLYRLTRNDISLLNRYESYPTVYDQIQITVRSADNREIPAFTYQKIRADPSPPSILYFHQIWRVYKDLNFDESGLLRAVEDALSANGKSGEPWKPGLR